MNVEIGLWVAAQFPEKEYINGIFVTVQIRYNVSILEWGEALIYLRASIQTTGLRSHLYRATHKRTSLILVAPPTPP
jgi:hypothetical protein